MSKEVMYVNVKKEILADFLRLYGQLGVFWRVEILPGGAAGCVLLRCDVPDGNEGVCAQGMHEEGQR